MITHNQTEKQWAEAMATRVRRAYVGRHVSRAVTGAGVASLLFVGVFVWQSMQVPAIDATITAEFLSVQVEATYSQVYPNASEASFWEL